MDYFGKANTAKEEHKIAQYKEELGLIITAEVTERAVEAKEEPMIKSLYDKMNAKDVEWIANRYKSGKVYKIKYDLNGGEGELPETKEIRRGFSILLAKNTGTKGGVKFLGWCEDKEGEGTLIAEDTSFRPTGEEEEIILYAIWSKPPEGKDTASRSPKELTYDWPTLSEMANAISATDGINQSTVEVLIDKESLLVGDWIVIKYGPQEILKKFADFESITSIEKT